MIISSVKEIIPTEAEEQEAVVDYLKLLISNGERIKFTAIPNGTYSPHVSQRVKNKKTGLNGGLPDLFLIINDTPLFIEMKRIKKGVVSADQKSWMEAIQRAGIDCHVCKGAKQAILTINHYLKN